MKKIVSVAEVSGEGLEGLMGEKVILFCLNYFYAGTLIGVNDTCVLLDAADAGIVYETGQFGDKAWKDYQKIGQPLYVQRDKIEAFCLGK